MGDFDDVDMSDVGSYEPLEGIFLASVIAADVKKKPEEGKIGVQHEYELLEGRVGMKVREYFNIKHPKPAEPGKASVEQIGRGQYKKRCQDLGFADVPAWAHEAIGKKLYIKLVKEPSFQINPNTGEPYMNSVVKNAWAVGKQPLDKPTGFEAMADVKKSKSIDEDNIPF